MENRLWLQATWCLLPTAAPRGTSRHFHPQTSFWGHRKATCLWFSHLWWSSSPEHKLVDKDSLVSWEVLSFGKHENMGREKERNEPKRKREEGPREMEKTFLGEKITTLFSKNDLILSSHYDNKICDSRASTLYLTMHGFTRSRATLPRCDNFPEWDFN